LTRNVYLVGFMGCGKSTVGPLLARRLGCGFVDTDSELERSTGQSIDEIFAEHGEAHFRGVEAELLQAVARGKPAVVATGGGAMLSAPNRRLLWNSGWTVWIDVPLPAIVGRLSAALSRPLWSDLDAGVRRILFERRRAVYALARLRVVAATDDPVRLAERISLQLAGGP